MPVGRVVSERLVTEIACAVGGVGVGRSACRERAVCVQYLSREIAQRIVKKSLCEWRTSCAVEK